MSPESATSASAVTPLTEPLVYSVHTGVPVADGGDADAPTAARLGLEPPRYCGQCGRRMVVQVVPTGWTARCSRHGSVDSSDPTRR